MGFEFTIISDETFIRPPNSATGWFILFILGALIGLTLYSWRGYHPRPLKQWGKNQFILFGILLLATPLCSLFLGIHIYPGAEYPPPGGIVDTVDRQIMIFSAVPWMLAGGFLGPLPAAILGMLSGLLRALFETHNPFTPFVIAILAILFSVAVCQRYRTPIFHYLRKPAIAAVMLAFIYPLFYLATTPFSVNGSILTLLDYALNNLLSTWLVASFELLLGGFAAQLVHLLLPALWGSKAPLQPSPAERSLQARFLYSMAPIGILFVIALMIGCWIVAGAVARDLLKNQMATTVKTVASQLPYYFQTGHTMINQLAGDERLYTTEPSQLSALLEKMIKPGTFFSQLVVLDDSGQLLSAYPDGQYTGGQMPIEERAGIQFALSGFSNPSFTIPPVKNSQTAQTSFMSPVTDENQIVRRILIGRVNMEKNPLITSLITSLNEIDEFEGQGMILNENNQVVVHQNPEMILTTYPGRTTDQEPFYTEPALDGAPQLVYFQKIDGGEWAVVMNIPVEIAQRLSLRIAAPLLGIIAILAFLAVIVLNLGLRVVTNSLESLANEAESIAEGNLDQPFPVNGEDEIGKLRQGFEKMRVSLKSRLDELNRLLKVSQGVAANLEIEQAIQPVLDSALAMGAVLSRVVLTPSVIPELDGNSAEPASFSAGSARNLYDSLDEQIFELTRQRERIILTNINRPRLLTLTPGTPHPASLIAFALRHENQFFGAMWVAYDQHHTFSEDEVRFLTMLASQAALAAANTRLFMNAEIGRQRLAAILASSPDPVLVTDQHKHLVLANPAAWQVFGFGIESGVGRPIEQVIKQPELLDLFNNLSSEKRSTEVSIQEGQVYLAAVSSVEAEGRRVGQVCVLRDVTQFKELDALKSEFVSTVSHDLRTPLALMRGYATMLEMVGQLNEQQTGYVRKIVGGVENMSRLVNNLLDLGRIEAGVGLQFEQVSPREVIENTASSLQIQAAQKKIQLKTEILAAEAGLTIEADPGLLQQALLNLVENAIRYTQNDGKVNIRVRAQAERVIFEVNDNGIGISPMDQPRLFEKFYRGPQTNKSESQGSGLGLAIVQSIVQWHHGQVWVESQLGSGSTFYLAIPRSQSKSTK